MNTKPVIATLSRSAANTALEDLIRYCESNGTMLDSMQKVVIGHWLGQVKWEVPGIHIEVDEEVKDPVTPMEGMRSAIESMDAFMNDRDAGEVAC